MSTNDGLGFFLSSQPQLQHPISYLLDKGYNHQTNHGDYNDNPYQLK